MLRNRSLCKYEHNCRNDDCLFLHDPDEFNVPTDKNEKGNREVPGSQSKATKADSVNNKAKAKAARYPEWEDTPATTQDLEKEIKDLQAKLARAKLDEQAKKTKEKTDSRAASGQKLAAHGVIAYKAKDLALAVKLYTQAISTRTLDDSELVVILYNRATAHFEIHAYDPAWEDAMSVLNIKPNHYKCYRLQARIRAKQDNVREAEKLYATAIALAENKDMVFVFDTLNEFEVYSEKMEAQKAEAEEAMGEKLRRESLQRKKAEAMKEARGDKVWILVKDMTFYEILEIEVQSSDAVIKKAYHQALLKYHTDRVDSHLCSTRVTQVLFEIRRILLDSDLRHQYDRTMHTLERM